MTDARRNSFWHRAGPLIVIAAIGGVGAAAQGCGGESTTSTGTTSTSDTSTSTSTATGAGGGTTTSTTGTSSATGTGGGMMHMADLKTGADVHGALDATPDPDNKVLYFTANGPNGPGVYSAPSDGSKPDPTAIFPTMPDDPASPFVAPFGIAISTDGKTLYVADAGAGSKQNGAIYALATTGGMPAIVGGTDGVHPRAVDVTKEGGVDVLYFSGNDGMNGPGVYKVTAAGGAVTKVAAGAGFNDPSGLAVASNGDVYVADTSASANGSAQLLKIGAGTGTAVVIVDEIRVGYPCGVALTMDEKTAFISALDPATLTDRLLAVNLADNSVKEVPEVTAVIGTFKESAGLHRAKNVDAFAWADSSAGPQGGRVYAITLK